MRSLILFSTQGEIGRAAKTVDDRITGGFVTKASSDLIAKGFNYFGTSQVYLLEQEYVKL